MNKLLIEVTEMDSGNKQIYDYSSANWQRIPACMRSGYVHMWAPKEAGLNTVVITSGRKWHVFEQTDAMRNQRMNLRNFLLTATMEELVKESYMRKMAGDYFAVHCISELIDEAEDDRERTEYESRLRRGILAEEQSHTGEKP